jgi:hypothetical protein
MNIFLGLGMGVVTIALTFYSLFFFSKKRAKSLSIKICILLSLGALFDISGTILMIIGSRKIPITVHGILGYSALNGMLIETVLIWRYFLKQHYAELKKSLNRYTTIAYLWWVAAYIAGGIIAMIELR